MFTGGSICTLTDHGSQIQSSSHFHDEAIDPFATVEDNAELTQLLLDHIRGANETLSFMKFKNSPRMHTLNLKTVFSARMPEIAREISLNPNVQELVLKLAKLDGAELAPLTTLLQTQSTIRTLDLSGSILRDDQHDLIRTMLVRTTTLQSLTLAYSQMTSDYFVSTVEGVTHNSSLTFLDLSNNSPFVPAGIAALTKMILGNNTLTTFLTTSLMIKDPAGVKGLTSALLANTTMTHLSLNGPNHFESEQLQDFAEVLKTGTTLTELTICAQQIHPEGFESIATALSGNQTLTDFTLFGISGRLPSAAGIISILSSNSTLQSLRLTTFSITGPERYSIDQQAQIIELHDKHPSMRVLALARESFHDFNDYKLAEINARRRVNYQRINKTLFELLLPALRLA